MGSRLKRRSSIGFGGRRDSSSPPESHTPEMFDQDDDEERRVRNLQRRQAKNLDTAISQDSPGVERAGSSRRSIGGLSGLSAAQLAEHYNNLNVTQIFLIPTPPALKYLQYLIQIFYRILGKFLKKLPMKRCSVLDK